MRRLYYLCIVLVCVSCFDNTKTKKNKNSSEIKEYFQTELKENIDYIGTVKDVTFLGDSLIALISKNPNRLYFYNFKGEQVKMITSAKDTKNNFLNPTLIKSFNNILYVWCADLHNFFFL